MKLTLGSGTDNDLAHINIGWLLNCERNSSGDRASKRSNGVRQVQPLYLVQQATVQLPLLFRCLRR